jgi:hypothetical protein
MPKTAVLVYQNTPPLAAAGGITALIRAFRRAGAVRGVEVAVVIRLGVARQIAYPGLTMEVMGDGPSLLAVMKG